MTSSVEVTETPRVLVVEDDPVSATLIQRLFAGQGMLVDHAQDGAVALELHRNHPYRIVVSDWMMPEMDGVTLCKEFRKIAGPYVYFILCTAKGQKEDRLEAYDAGVDDFLTKPLDRAEMQARLKVARRILATEDVLQKQKGELETTATQLSDMNHSLEIASARFRELFNGLPVACFTFDESGLIQEWNRSANATFGIPKRDAVKKPVWNVLAKGHHPIWRPERIQRIFAEDTQPTFDWEYEGSKDKKYLACSVICLHDEGKPISAICANLDITERKRAEQRVEEQMLQINHYAAQLSQQKLELEKMNVRLSHLAITDGLTGLSNHRRFQEMLEESVDEFGRTLEPFSLVLLDIDHFKKVNDELGHQVGDEVLQQFAETLRSQSRSYELPARYGGEEFAIILRNCDEEAAIRASERFRRYIETQPWRYRKMTASFGVTTCSMPGTNPKALIMQADNALYAAKQGGRNRTVHWSQLAGNDLPTTLASQLT
jgi:two-component system, cell cycle response regulator